MGESCRLSSGRAASTRGASGTVRRVVRERRKTTETRSARRGLLLREVKKREKRGGGGGGDVRASSSSSPQAAEVASSSAEAATPTHANAARGRGSGAATASINGVRLGAEARTRASFGVRFIGSGSAVPDVEITNDELSRVVDTSDEWIATRTGIRSRRVLKPGPLGATELATRAAKKALEMGGVDAKDVDMIVLATSTPDDCFGGACLLQEALGATNAFAFDVTAACSGFVVGVTTASNFMIAGAAKNVLVVGADAMSRIVDWQDRGTCILFGDGAGAVLMQRSDIVAPAYTDDETKKSDASERNGAGGAANGGPPNSSSGSTSGGGGVLGFALHSDGSGNKHLTAAHHCDSALDAEVQQQSSDDTNGNPAEVSGDACDGKIPSAAHSSFGNITMSGSDVFKFAVRAVPAVVDEAMREAGIDDVDWLVLHQANQRILDSAAQRLGIDSAKVVSNLANYGNTSAASIPLVLDECVREGKIRRGDVVAMAGFGAGLTWGCAIIEWG